MGIGSTTSWHRGAAGPLAAVVLLVAGAAAQNPPRAPDPAARSAFVDSSEAWIARSRPDLVAAAADSLVPLARARRDSALLRSLVLYRGMALAAFGRGRSSEADLALARELSAAARDTTDLIRAVRWLSVSLTYQRRVQEALDLYLELRDLAVATDDSVHLAWAHVGLGYDRLNREEGQASEHDYRLASGIFARHGLPSGEAWARHGQGMALWQQGRFRAAATAFRRTVVAAAEVGDAMNEAMGWNSLGELERAFGDPSLAVRYYERALGIHLAEGHMREAVMPALNLARSQADLGQHRSAAAGLEEMLGVCRREGYADLEAMIQITLAQIHLQQGHPRQAAARGRRVLAMGAILPASTRSDAGLVLDAALADLDSSRAGLAVLEACASDLEASEHVQAQLELADARGRRLLDLGRPAEALAILAPARRRTEGTVLTSLQLSLLVAEARAQAALDRPDSARAGLQLAAELWERERSLPTDPQWRERLTAAARELFAVAGRLLLDHPAATPAAQRTRDAFDFLQRYKARTLQERLRGPGYELAPAVPARRITLAALQRDVLREGEVFLDVYLAPGSGIAFAASADTAVVFALPGADSLGPRLDLYLELLASPGRQVRDPALAATAGRSLVRELAAGLAPLSRGLRSLYWSPDDVLHRLPLAAIPLPASGAAAAPPDAASGWTPWPCVRVPSATVLAELRGRASREGPRGGVLAIAGRRGPDGKELAGAAAEVAWLAHSFRQVTAPDPWHETESLSLVAEPGRSPWSVIHLASHARIDDQRPWNSTLDLGGAAGLRAGEVADLALAANLTVLSSCASAAGQLVAGEGVLGLASGFLSAGVPAVMATLWSVDDRVTAQLMGDFYRELAGGATAATALQRAQTACRRRPETAHPFYWAGFVLVGDGTVAAPLRPRLPRLGPWLAGAAALTVVAAVITSRRRGRPGARA